MGGEKNGTAIIDKYLYKMLTAVAKSVDEKRATPIFIRLLIKSCVSEISLWIAFGFWKKDWIFCILFQFHCDLRRGTPSWAECFLFAYRKTTFEQSRMGMYKFVPLCFKKGHELPPFSDFICMVTSSIRRLKSLVKWGKNPLT